MLIGRNEVKEVHFSHGKSFVSYIRNDFQWKSQRIECESTLAANVYSVETDISIQLDHGVIFIQNVGIQKKTLSIYRTNRLMSTKNQRKRRKNGEKNIKSVSIHSANEMAMNDFVAKSKSFYRRTIISHIR